MDRFGTPIVHYSTVNSCQQDKSLELIHKNPHNILRINTNFQVSANPTHAQLAAWNRAWTKIFHNDLRNDVFVFR